MVKIKITSTYQVKNQLENKQTRRELVETKLFWDRIH